MKLITTSSKLLIQSEREERIIKCITPSFRKLLSGFDIYLVSETDLDNVRSSEIDRHVESEGESEQARDRADSFDTLGVYIRHHSVLHRPVILISPEKILSASRSILEERSGMLQSESFDVLMAAVIVHELAHKVMDHMEACDYHTTSPLDLQFDSNQTGVVSGGGQDCTKIQRVGKAEKAVLGFLEESLANAFILVQDFKGSQCDLLKSFIRGQPDGYKHALCWKIDFDEIHRAAMVWKNFKRLVFEWKLACIYEEFPAIPLADIINALNSYDAVYLNESLSLILC